MHALNGDRSHGDRVPISNGLGAALHSVLLAPDDLEAGDFSSHRVVPSRVIAVLVGGQDLGDRHPLVHRLL